MQALACAWMAKFDLLKVRVREKDEPRYATMEYGGQCVLIMAGMKLLQVLSVISLGTIKQVS